MRYRGIDVYKLDSWVQGPAMLQALNILENFDLGAMPVDGVASQHGQIEAMKLAFADVEEALIEEATLAAEGTTRVAD